jgi:hypothetical protein
MKTQQQHKALVPKGVFGAEKLVQKSDDITEATAFDNDMGFDTHWSYSYVMDYILSHQKVKRRKA